MSKFQGKLWQFSVLREGVLMIQDKWRPTPTYLNCLAKLQGSIGY